jgi:hypothetical protein
MVAEAQHTCGSEIDPSNAAFLTGLPDGMYIFKPKILIWVNFAE